MSVILDSLKDFWNNQKILSLFIIGFFIRFAFCFFPIELNLDELDYYWTMNGFCSTLHKVTLQDILFIYYFYGKNPFIILFQSLPLPIPRNSILTFCPAKFYIFWLLITPIYKIFGLFGVKLFLASINSIGFLTCKKLLGTITNDKDYQILGSIIYGFNFFSIYLSIKIMPENFYFGLSPLILYFFMKVAKEDKLSKNGVLYALFIGLFAICIDIRSSFAMPYILGVLILLIYKSSWKNLIKNLFLIAAFCIIGVSPILIYSLITFGDPFRQILLPIKVNSSIPLILEVNGIIFYTFLLIFTYIFSLPYIYYGLKKGLKEKNLLILVTFGWAVFQHLIYYNTPTFVINAQRWSLATLIGYTMIAIIGFEEKDKFWFLNKENYLRFYIFLSVIASLILIIIRYP